VPELNVQNQQKIEWPAQLVVAKAYVDQLARSQSLPVQQIADLRKAIEKADSSHKPAKLKKMAPSLETERRHGEDPGGLGSAAWFGRNSEASVKLATSPSLAEPAFGAGSAILGRSAPAVRKKQLDSLLLDTCLKEP